MDRVDAYKKAKTLWGIRYSKYDYSKVMEDRDALFFDEATGVKMWALTSPEDGKDLPMGIALSLGGRIFNGEIEKMDAGDYEGPGLWREVAKAVAKNITGSPDLEVASAIVRIGGGAI